MMILEKFFRNAQTKLFSIAAISFAAFLFANTTIVEQPIDPILRDQFVFSYYENVPMTNENVAKAIRDFKIKFPEVVYRQAMIESGNLKSKICKGGHNLFGMKRPGSRTTYALEKKFHGHAQYKSWLHSVADYRLWQAKKNIRSIDYYSFLKRCGYAQNPAYIKQLKGVKIPKEIRDILHADPVAFDSTGCVISTDEPLVNVAAILKKSFPVIDINLVSGIRMA